MPMNGNTMASEVKSALQGLGYTIDTDAEDAWKAICGAIVNHIKNNAAIATTVTVTSVSGVTTGGGVSGPGAGTGSGTIS